MELASETQAVAVSAGGSSSERRAPEAAPTLAPSSNHFHLCCPRLLSADRPGVWGAERGNREGKSERDRGREGLRESKASPPQSDRVLRLQHPRSGIKCARLETALSSPALHVALMHKAKANSNLAKPQKPTNLSTERFQSTAAPDPSLMDGPGPYPAGLARRAELTRTAVLSSAAEKCHKAEGYLRRGLCPSVLFMPLRKALPSGK